MQFRLRPGVTFHDGTPFDAAAVKSNLERAKTQEGSVAINDLAVIDTIEVLDDHTVDLHLTGPAASLPLVLSDRGGAMVSPAKFDVVDTEPVGAGAFTLDNYEQDVKIRYVAWTATTGTPTTSTSRRSRSPCSPTRTLR